MAKIASLFISHAEEDQTFVQTLETELKKSDIDVWVYYREILPGDDISANVNQALEGCDVVLLVWSEAASMSKWVTREWGAANSSNKRIIPCRLDDTKLPALLADKAAIDFRNISTATEQLLATLRSVLPKSVVKHQGIQEDAEASEQSKDHGFNETNEEIELIINRDFNSFSSKDKIRLLLAIEDLLSLPYSIKITHARPGTIVLRLELDLDDAHRLLSAVKAGRLSEYDVIDARLYTEKNTRVLLGPLLWEPASYWQRFVSPNGDEPGLFSTFYADEQELLSFAYAIEEGEKNEAHSLMQEALTLAHGLPKAGINSLNGESVQPLASVLSNVRLRQDHKISTVYFALPDLRNGSALHLATQEDQSLSMERVKQILEAFSSELKFLADHDSQYKTRAVLTLLEKYFNVLPPLNGGEHSDVPLFAVSKMVAAIVACWPKEKHKLPQVPSREEMVYLLIQGDLSGIQDYIYRIGSAKGAAKSLKGRSFELLLLTDMAANYVLRRLSLPVTNLIYSGGGKFYVLAPAKAERQVAELRIAFEEFLYHRYHGDIYLALESLALSGSDLDAQRFAYKWEEVGEASYAAKRRKFSSIILNEFDEFFEPNDKGQTEPICDACGREKSSLMEKQEDGVVDRRICSQCDELEDLGRALARVEHVIEVVNETTKITDTGLIRLAPFVIQGECVIYYVTSKDTLPEIEGDFVTYYSLEVRTFDKMFPLEKQLKSPKVDFGVSLYGGKDVPCQENGSPVEYDELANRSRGLKRLGILRMDMDNLAKIFRSGLGDYDGAKLSRLTASPARMQALSWQINLFFSHALNRIRARDQFKDHIIVLYSGGDDLFAVGSWDRIANFANTIRQEFETFVKNPQLSISGGIMLLPRKYPIHRGAELAGEAEDRAKKLDSTAKDAMTFLDKPLRWHDFDITSSIRDELYAAIADESNGRLTLRPLNKGILDRLGRIYYLYDQNRRLKEKQLKDEKRTISIADHLQMLMYDKWRWRLTYALRRFMDNNPQYVDMIERLQQALLDNNWINEKNKKYDSNQRNIVDFVDVPVRWVEFLTRKED